MPTRYQDAYPSEPLVTSRELSRPRAGDLLTLEFFEAEPASMPTQRYDQHHILLNLNEVPHRVENFRDGEHRVFDYTLHQVVVTPAGVESGWRWHARSRVVVITIEPEKLDRFARLELGVLLTPAQLRNEPLTHAPDLCQAGDLLRDALQQRPLGHEVLFESLARIFLVKLIDAFGEVRDASASFDGNFSTVQYKRVLDFVESNYSDPISVEELAQIANLSESRFSAVFKETIGESPHQFVMSYRVEKAQHSLGDRERTLSDIALACGFADQAHFSRVFKRHTGMTPGQFRSGAVGR